MLAGSYNSYKSIICFVCYKLQGKSLSEHVSKGDRSQHRVFDFFLHSMKKVLYEL
ncbi:MAG: hypothetical protein OFPI_33570 [Osedax symbiont Rs2]|nr:MAG: hypothetical protein OFPI_33570 [Osedax symbiont Rs2]